MRVGFSHADRHHATVSDLTVLVFELNGERRDSEIDFIIDKIYDAYDEMDKVVKQITVLVNQGSSDIDRDDIKL